MAPSSGPKKRVHFKSQRLQKLRLSLHRARIKTARQLGTADPTTPPRSRKRRKQKSGSRIFRTPGSSSDNSSSNSPDICTCREYCVCGPAAPHPNICTCRCECERVSPPYCTCVCECDGAEGIKTGLLCICICRCTRDNSISSSTATTTSYCECRCTCDRPTRDDGSHYCTCTCTCDQSIISYCKCNNQEFCDCNTTTPLCTCVHTCVVVPPQCTFICTCGRIPCACPECRCETEFCYQWALLQWIWRGDLGIWVRADQQPCRPQQGSTIEGDGVIEGDPVVVYHP
eukprot:sb/3467752/